VRPAKGDASFADHSDGFRPHRAAQHAVEPAPQAMAEGEGWVGALDLEQGVDRVHHDHLRGSLAQRLRDQRVWPRIRGFLQAGVREGGWVSPTAAGPSPGGPLAPL
jgi:RNA-directed DNA polymerase